VVLADVVMPQMPGQEAAKRIRVLRPGIKVLFMSGYTQGLLDTQGVVTAGVNVLQKPFTEASLLIRLGQLMASTGPTWPEPSGEPAVVLKRTSQQA
jgi:two-component system, cell cycle sensor histidine kinase and response regulator CckA